MGLENVGGECFFLTQLVVSLHQTSSRSDASGALRHNPVFCNACIMYHFTDRYTPCVEYC